MRVLAALLLIFSVSASGLAKTPVQENKQKLSAQEEQEVREFAGRVAADIERTRDVTHYFNKPPASDLFDKACADPNDSDGMVDTHVARKVGRHELRRFYFVLWNLAYLSESYVFSRFLYEKTAVEDLLPQQQYPAHVVRILEQHPTLKQWWSKNFSGSETRITTVRQFYSVLKTYQQAVVLMRAYFRQHPPERTAIYKQNLIYLRDFLKAIFVDTCEADENCAGLPVGTQTVEVNLPVLHLVLVRQNGRLQVLFIALHDD